MGQIPNALKHDGAPPLYYYLLHFWIVLFGQSNDAVRSLSGVIAVITLPVGWLCGKRLGGRAVAWTMLVLLASAPFAVYYATESRMYALVILLTGCGFLALGRAVDRPRPGNLIAVAVVTAALLYTQYWAIYLVAMVGIWLVVSVIRTRRHGHPEAAPWAALIAVAVGGVLFLPWVPTFLYQAKYTGTPWAAPPNFSAVINALTGFTDNQGSTLQTGTNQGRLLAVIYFAMLALAIFGIGRSGRIIELDLRTRPRARSLCFVVLGTLFAAIAGGILTASAFSSRYAAVVFLPFLLLDRVGDDDTAQPEGTCRDRRAGRRGRAGFVRPERHDAADPGQRRGRSHQRAGQARGRDRLLPRPAGPVGLPPDTESIAIRYVDLPAPNRSRRSSTGSTMPTPCMRRTRTPLPPTWSRRPGPNHHVWFVWESMYQTYGVKCETISTDLLNATTKNGGGGRNVVTSRARRSTTSR